MSVRLAVFDCDGTLSDGQAGVCMAMERAFAECGLDAPAHPLIRRIVGLSLPQAVARLAPHANDALQTALVDSYRSSYRGLREDGSLREPLFEGIPDLLRRLHSAGWVLGVATGKSDRGLANTLAVNGLTDLFTTLHTADRHPSKPHPAMLKAAMDDAMAAPEVTVMIGDTVYDMQMAKNAGTRAVGVSWGYHETRELSDEGAIGVADCCGELEALILG